MFPPSVLNLWSGHLCDHRGNGSVCVGLTEKHVMSLHRRNNTQHGQHCSVASAIKKHSVHTHNGILFSCYYSVLSSGGKCQKCMRAATKTGIQEEVHLINMQIIIIIIFNRPTSFFAFLHSKLLDHLHNSHQSNNLGNDCLHNMLILIDCPVCYIFCGSAWWILNENHQWKEKKWGHLV